MTLPDARVAIFLAALACGPAIADVWDSATESDDGVGTDNSLAHGSIQVHDLGVRPGPLPDQDWFRVWLAPYRSFEVQIDGFTGDLNDLFGSLEMDLVNIDGTTVRLSSNALNSDNYVRRISWPNNTSSPELSYIRVFNAACGINCTASDQYTIRARETTVALARFNNSSSQITILFYQNSSGQDVGVNVRFWSPSGVLLHSEPRLLGLNELAVLNTSAVVPGQSGSITITHSGPYGTLNAKAVALEPATGFSFDTPGVIRP